MLTYSGTTPGPDEDSGRESRETVVRDVLHLGALVVQTRSSKTGFDCALAWEVVSRCNKACESLNLPEALHLAFVCSQLGWSHLRLVNSIVALGRAKIVLVDIVQHWLVLLRVLAGSRRQSVVGTRGC